MRSSRLSDITRHNRLVDAAEEPRPPASKKLTGRDAWRVRTGNWRVIYEIHDDELFVVVVAAGNRRDVYRG
ncbi:type II toxin-antitoxin system RelE/ParE family toxin [Jonesia denitrificans]|uniref:Addiction module antitoxin n=1 Tax=Jonesia denitrificans (strain ATCC 14870 / DSM 20603 / BCRC 15368 / CIP 55.134 / JCM 11481 / NBRC 15587 / NCTC 10816 / Prevot 55134) TaxID=471856 RepID=C7R1X3_JONDD|nr:addiction module antitoxin [Jonesia denitrificans DSM 20603]ASE07913.1 addiction module antitoxin [Jonesia denitrificans]QXB42522.1 type II toxin-antitoxin system RelE/ParE family toxin [Jonesia denitrificans]SQH20420.1 Uncharacterised protein [Jonesia denitrificans]